MSSTAAHKEASAKYQAKARASGKQSQLNVTVTPTEKKLIDNAVNVFGLSRARLIVAAVKYCLDNGVDLIDSSDKPLDKMP